MAVAQSQYLRIFDAAGVTYERWQSYYATSVVTWESESWIYIPFIADGFTAGVSGDDANISVTAPATLSIMQAFDDAITEGRLVELKIYTFDPGVDNDEPQAGQDLVGLYIGQVVGGTGDLTSMTIQLGSALSPVGSQVPPRKFTTLIMGQGCRL